MDTTLIAKFTAAILSLPQLQDEIRKESYVENLSSAIYYAVDRATCSDGIVSDCKRIWRGSPEDLGLGLITLNWWESKFSERIQAGNCYRGECDYFAIRNSAGIIMKEFFRARSGWQIQFNPVLMTRQEWIGIVGTNFEGIANAAWVATKVISASAEHCHSIVFNQCVISNYAGVRGIYAGAQNRFATFEKLKKISDGIKP